MSMPAKISSKTKHLCKEIKEATGEKSQVAILEKAAAYYYRKIRMESLNQAFFKLKQRPKAWKKYQKEQKLLEGTVSDGLEKE